MPKDTAAPWHDTRNDQLGSRDGPMESSGRPEFKCICISQLNQLKLFLAQLAEKESKKLLERKKQEEEERRQEDEFQRQLEAEKRQIEEEQRRLREKKVKVSFLFPSVVYFYNRELIFIATH